MTPTPEPPGRTAVVVHRDDATRSAVASTLIRAGFRIVGQAADPARAGALTREHRPDIVLLAVDPGPDDVPAMAQVTAERIAPVVALSDDISPALLAAVRDAGAHGFLPAFPSRVTMLPTIELAIARFADNARLIAEVGAVTRQLETRKLIDRAKGLLMAHRGMTEPDAFRWIQRTAMDRRKSSAAVAAQVIAEFDQSPVRTAS